MTTRTTFILPTLYIIDKLERRRQWRVWVTNNIVHTEYGLVGGKLITSVRGHVGVNNKNKNKTTSEEQTKREAEKSWTKKLTTGYTVDSEDIEGTATQKRVLEENAKMGGRNHTTASKIRGRRANIMKKSVGSNMIELTVNQQESIITPMKAKVWEVDEDLNPLPRVAKYYKEDFWIQPKLDGFRCLATLIENKVVMTSNGRKQLKWFTSHRKEIKKILSNNNCLDGLDGELCVPLTAMKDSTFSKISSIASISRSTPHLEENNTQLHVFDLIDHSGEVSQEERFRLLELAFKDTNFKLITKVETVKSNNYLDVMEHHSVWVGQGLEGIIIRGVGCNYLPSLGTAKRSLSLRKYKTFDDNEYEIIGADLDPGVDSEFFVWLVKTEDDLAFRTKPMGTREERRMMYADHKSYIGKLLKVKYQGLSKEDGVPRFPIGIGIRPVWDL